MNEQKRLRSFRILLCAVLFAFAVWLVFRYVLPSLLPFVIALAIARLIEPVVRWFTAKYRMKRGFVSAVCTILVITLIIALIALAVYREVYELDAFVRQLPHALSGAADTFKRLSGRLSVFMEKLPPELSVYIDDVAAGFAAKAAQLPAELSASILRTVSSAVSAAPKIILSVATCAISVFFMSACYPDITAFILRQIPERMRAGFMDIKSHMFKTFGKWLRAQAVMCCITAVELCAAFLLMGIDYAVLLAVAIALIDALPVFGTGTVLLPWAACSLIAGNTQRALMLTATYLITLIVRNCTEPRIVGARLGLSPVATLMAMYVGFCAIGVLGMILFPILLIMLGQINERLGKKLWK